MLCYTTYFLDAMPYHTIPPFIRLDTQSVMNTYMKDEKGVVVKISGFFRQKRICIAGRWV